MQKTKGFTLIELVVVIAVLAILAGVAIPKFIDVTAQAKTSALQADLGVIRAGILMVAANNMANGIALGSAYPGSLGDSAAGLIFQNILEPAAQADFAQRGWTGSGSVFTNATYGSASYTYLGNSGSAATRGQFK